MSGLVCSLSVAEAQQTYTLENDRMQARIDLTSGALCGLESKLTGWDILQTASCGRAFEANIKLSDGRFYVINESSQERPRVQIEDDALTFTWERLKVGSQTLDLGFSGRIRMTDDGLVYDGRLDNASDAVVEQFSWPFVGEVTLPENTRRMLFQYMNYTKFNTEELYPREAGSGWSNLPEHSFVLVNNTLQGLYLSSMDHKRALDGDKGLNTGGMGAFSPSQRFGEIQMQKAYDDLGPVKKNEVKAALIFGLILLVWATDKLHGLNSTVVAMLGAVIMLLPQTKLLNWNDVDIPWHLMIFSAGAYSLGAGLTATKLMDVLTIQLMEALGMETMSYFTLYAVLTAIFIASHFIFQSKNMRTIIYMPIVIGIAQTLKIDILALAMPVALCINCCWSLPFNAKPNAMLYGTNKYTMGESFKYGFIMSVLYWVLLLIAGATYMHWMGICPSFF